VSRPAKNFQRGSLDAEGGSEAEAELCRLMAGYLDGRLDAFDALYAALAGRPVLIFRP
jgi:hypothetical protein